MRTGVDVAKRSPMPIDVLVGQNIRICRLQQRLSQTELGQRIGVTFQQVQKYEKGANRVGASRLTQIAEVLGISLMTLFDGSSAAPHANGQAHNGEAAHGGQTPHALLAKPHSLRLLQGFDKIGSDAARSAIVQLVDAIAQDLSPKAATRRK
jgi:transcriptional regulator with XRE-family HTH domain